VGAGERIPTLAAVLDWARGRGARVNIELKGDVSSRIRLVRAVMRIVGASRLGGETLLYSSFHPQIVFALARGMAEIPAAWLVHDRQRILKYTPGRRLLGAAAVHPQITLATPNKVARWQRAGVLVNVWTVNDIVAARRLDALGIDAIISDVPGAVLQGLKPAAHLPVDQS
jgi:glycerophosphoryl diester phosphodiesterase